MPPDITAHFVTPQTVALMLIIWPEPSGAQTFVLLVVATVAMVLQKQAVACCTVHDSCGAEIAQVSGAWPKELSTGTHDTLKRYLLIHQAADAEPAV